jgi:DNA primase
MINTTTTYPIVLNSIVTGASSLYDASINLDPSTMVEAPSVNWIIAAVASLAVASTTYSVMSTPSEEVVVQDDQKEARERFVPVLEEMVQKDAKASYDKVVAQIKSINKPTAYQLVISAASDFVQNVINFVNHFEILVHKIGMDMINSLTNFVQAIFKPKAPSVAVESVANDAVVAEEVADHGCAHADCVDCQSHDNEVSQTLVIKN